MKRSRAPHIATFALLGAVCYGVWVGIEKFRARVPRGAEPRHIREWRAISGSDAAGQTQIVVFSDFRCKACRYAHRILTELPPRLARSVSVKWLQLPLLGPASVEAARAAECVGTQGERSRLFAVLFQHQDSLGLLPWERVAEEARVAQPAQFARCTLDDRTRPSLVATAQLAEQLGVHSTPTVLIDSLLFGGMPSKQYLHRYLRNH